MRNFKSSTAVLNNTEVKIKRVIDPKVTRMVGPIPRPAAENIRHNPKYIPKVDATFSVSLNPFVDNAILILRKMFSKSAVEPRNNPVTPNRNLIRGIMRKLQANEHRAFKAIGLHCLFNFFLLLALLEGVDFLIFFCNNARIKKARIIKRIIVALFSWDLKLLFMLFRNISACTVLMTLVARSCRKFDAGVIVLIYSLIFLRFTGYGRGLSENWALLNENFGAV